MVNKRKRRPTHPGEILPEDVLPTAGLAQDKKETSSNGRLTGVEAALRRAGRRARELAAQTGTPLVIYSDGKIKKLRIPPKQMIKSS
jgi:hypothetical protein